MDDAKPPVGDETPGGETLTLKQRLIEFATILGVALFLLSLVGGLVGIVLGGITGGTIWEQVTMFSLYLLMGLAVVLGAAIGWIPDREGRVRPGRYLAMYIPMMLVIYLLYLIS